MTPNWDADPSKNGAVVGGRDKACLVSTDASVRQGRSFIQRCWQTGQTRKAQRIYVFGLWGAGALTLFWG